MKKELIIILLAITTLLSACNKTPTTTVVNNSTTAIQPLETESLIDMDTLTVVTMTDEEINEILELGDVTVTLNGSISKPNTMEGLYIYRAEVIDYTEYESNMTFLFGEYENLVTRLEPAKKTLGVYIRDVYSAYIYNSSMFEEVEYTMPWGMIWFVSHDGPVSEEERKVNMTSDEAKKQADEIIYRIGVTDFEYDSYVYYEETLQTTPEGTLSSPMGDFVSVFYRQKIQGVPLRSVLVEGRTIPYAKVNFDSKGVGAVMITEYDCEPYSKIEKCLTYEDSIDKFKDYVSNNIDYNGVNFDKVRFEYTITKEYIDGNFVICAIPHWHFYLERIPDTGNYMDVYINCVDGSIISG